MPPSGRKGKTRARRAPATEVNEASDVETPEALATPSRSSRKRARGTEAIAPASRNTRRKIKDTRAPDREDTEGTEPQEHSDPETEVAAPSEEDIIAHLKVADRHVNATEDFANDLLEGQENVPGYGKIAGRDWAFIIRKVEVNIGRPESQERLVAEENGHQPGPAAKTVIDIDLGPDRQVSRLHAIISYEPDSSQWFIIVNGRNGLRVDNNLLKRGNRSYLRNGSVIEIANTQMAFITTATVESEGPIWDASIIRQAQKSSEDEDDGEDDSRTNNRRLSGHPSARGQLHNSSAYGNDPDGGQRRTHPHANQAAPGTPMRSNQSLTKSSPAANYARGVMMESTETIDYSADSAKDLKPPHSYAQLIGMAILSTTEQQMTLSNIYKWIMANYAFYRFNTGGWQNSIRHNLSLNKAFTKIARRTDEPGKGMKWMIEPTEFDNFVQQGMKGCRRPGPIATQSTLGSPSSPMNAMMRANGMGLKRDEEITPPLNAFRPGPMEAWTPDRGPKPGVQIGLGINGDGAAVGGQEYDFLTRSTPRNGNGLTAMANAAGSPPALFMNNNDHIRALDTPFPMRPTQRLAPPSTLRRPSDFIQFSSPAPFWKMDGLVGSTPWRPFSDVSPLKTPFSGFKKNDTEEAKNAEDREGDGEGEKGRDGEEQDGGKKSPVIQSSSPPSFRAHSAGDASPTLSRPATAVAKTLSQLAAAAKEPSVNGTAHAQEEQSSSAVEQAASAAPPATTTTTTAAHAMNGNTNDQASPSYTLSSGQPTNGYHEIDDATVVGGGEDEGIDLAKGFQSISSFHQRNHHLVGMRQPPPPAPQVQGVYGR